MNEVIEGTDVSEIYPEEVKAVKPIKSPYHFALGFMFGLSIGLILMFSIFVFPIQKHTGPIQIVGGNSYAGYEMRRPDNEIFLMKFDDPNFAIACIKLKDLTYTDTSRDVRHFIKATIDEGK